MRPMSRLAAALIGAALLAPLSVTSVFATSPPTWYVDDDGMGTTGTGCNGSDPLPMTIQAAVDAASAGDRIMVCPGAYTGTVDIAKANLTVRSVKRWKAVIEPAVDHVTDTDLVTIHDASGIKFDGFRLLAPTEGTCTVVAAMIRVDDAADTVVRSNRVGVIGTHGLGGCFYQAGVQVSGNSGGTMVLRNRITDFEANAILEVSTGTVLIRNNHINYLHAAYGVVANGAYGIFAEPSSGGTVQIRRNRIESLDSAGSTTPLLAYGIYVVGGDLDIRHNTGHNVRTFIYALEGTSGVIQRNRAIENIQFGLHVAQSDNVVIAHNTMAGAVSGVDVDAGSSGNNFHDNNWTGPGPNDCEDLSSGSRTSNTANTWTNNSGGESSPSGICQPAP